MLYRKKIIFNVRYKKEGKKKEKENDSSIACDRIKLHDKIR